MAVLPPPNAHSDWRLLDLDSKTLDRVPPHKLLEYLADAQPDVSRAVWDALRMLNAGYEIKVKPQGKRDDSRATHPEGQQAIDLFLDELKRLYGSFDVIVNRLNLGAYMRGAYCSEVVLGDGFVPIDFATPDPVPFASNASGCRSEVTSGCPSNGRARSCVVHVPTFKYVPIDPMPDSPYGRSPAMPAIFPALFLLGLLHDLRRVVQQQGYPRLDLEVVTEAIQKLMPPQIKVDQKSIDWVQAAVAQVREEYRKLDPDDAFVHVDAVKVNRPFGTIDDSSLGAVDGMIRSLERLLVRALKTMPLLMGLVDGQSADQANRQWEVHASGIKSLRRSERVDAGEPARARAGGSRDRRRCRREVRGDQGGRDAQRCPDGGEANRERREEEVARLDQRRGSGGARSRARADRHARPRARSDRRRRRVRPGHGDRGRGGADHGTGRRSRGGVGASPTTRTGERFVPLGAGDGPMEVPAEVEITVDDEQRALEAWDDALPEYAGLLDAADAEEGPMQLRTDRVRQMTYATWAAMGQHMTPIVVVSTVKCQ